jgi:ketosteroid isomerase-like protein
MHPNHTLLEQFYQAFQRKDGAAMAACYAPDAHFQDAVFDLRGPEVGAMWRMLCRRGKDLELVYNDVDADADGGRAHWEATYTFSATGRKVLNIIDARFAFRDGLIVTHNDSFNFWTWSRQALGPTGLLLGWTPMLQNKVRATAKAGLDKFMADEAAK